MNIRTMVDLDKSKGAVILDRERIGELPEYCIHGSTCCVRCNMVCWLGSETLKLVQAGVIPLCAHCARELESSGALPPAGRIGNIQDHLRKDGPHE